MTCRKTIVALLVSWVMMLLPHFLHHFLYHFLLFIIISSILVFPILSKDHIGYSHYHFCNPIRWHPRLCKALHNTSHQTLIQASSTNAYFNLWKGAVKFIISVYDIGCFFWWTKFSICEECFLWCMWFCIGWITFNLCWKILLQTSLISDSLSRFCSAKLLTIAHINKST